MYLQNKILKDTVLNFSIIQPGINNTFDIPKTLLSKNDHKK